jgi:hypothetical protein
VVEREIELQEFAAREPTGVGGIVAAARFPPGGNRVVENADRVPARIPLRIGVDPADAADSNLDARLLPNLSRARLFRRFAHFAEAARKRPLSLERRSSPANEQDSAAAIPGPGVDGELRTPGGPPTDHGRPP